MQLSLQIKSRNNVENSPSQHSSTFLLDIRTPTSKIEETAKNLFAWCRQPGKFKIAVREFRGMPLPPRRTLLAAWEYHSYVFKSWKTRWASRNLFLCQAFRKIDNSSDRREIRVSNQSIKLWKMLSWISRGMHVRAWVMVATPSPWIN